MGFGDRIDALPRIIPDPEYQDRQSIHIDGLAHERERIRRAEPAEGIGGKIPLSFGGKSCGMKSSYPLYQTNG